MTWRNEPLRSGALKSWLDADTALPAGRLSMFYIYVGRNINRPSNQNTAFLRLQIWRPIAGYQYSLAYEKRVEVKITDQQGLLYAVSVLLLF